MENKSCSSKRSISGQGSETNLMNCKCQGVTKRKDVCRGPLRGKACESNQSEASHNHIGFFLVAVGEETRVRKPGKKQEGINRASDNEKREEKIEPRDI